VLDEIVIERPENMDEHLCADKGYSGGKRQTNPSFILSLK
jgi:hypothetical protein